METGVATEGVTQLLHLLDEAFQGSHWHSLLGNLRSLDAEDWAWVPPGGDRSIQDIVRHVGGSKYMYHNHAFDDAMLTWGDSLVDGDEALSSVTTAIAWLREGHARLRQSIAVLNDAELLRERATNWGELKETRWIVATMIQHDLYHAGEINHIRSLKQGNDRWAYAAGL
jgi:uncharacterized damage-inducible protein DinB